MLLQETSVALVIAFGLAILSIANMIIWLYALYSIKLSIKCLFKLEDDYLVKSEQSCISVIIPTRNEEETIPLLLKSLINQKGYESMEIVIVDDDSTDNTADIVKEYMRKYQNIKYIRVDKIPHGWMPKPYLYYIGYRSSSGNVLFFIDGDTWIKSNDLLLKVMNAILQANGIVSLLPTFMCRTIRCKLVETLLTTFSHAFMGFNRVYNKNKKLAWYYGCCWGIKKEVYEELGTHEVVKDSIVEDRDFAEHVKRNGYDIRIIHTSGDVITRWYDRIHDTINVLARVLRRHGVKKSRALISSLLVFLGYYLPVITLIYGIVYGFQILSILGIIQYTLLIIDHVYGARLNGYSKLYSIVSPIIGVILSIGLLKATLSEKVYWKDRIVEEPLRARK